MNTVTGRVVKVVRHGYTINGNPMKSIILDEDTEPGAYGIERDPNGPMQCGECGQRWTEDITPAGRCPWEAQHGEYETYRISNDSGLVYDIGNREYRDTPHTFALTTAGRISHVVHD